MSQPIGISTDKDLEEELATLLESSGSSGPSDNTPHHTDGRTACKNYSVFGTWKASMNILSFPFLQGLRSAPSWKDDGVRRGTLPQRTISASRAVSRLDQGAHAEEKKELSLLATPYDSASDLQCHELTNQMEGASSIIDILPKIDKQRAIIFVPSTSLTSFTHTYVVKLSMRSLSGGSSAAGAIWLPVTETYLTVYFVTHQAPTTLQHISLKILNRI
uniref:Uncharacterized protein n=1 Tax=Timema tahoe TaxID=61484 RepID=A0A7R9IM02_9NEOP|nr:unnamed protein product [Timema tahoe]